MKLFNRKIRLVLFCFLIFPVWVSAQGLPKVPESKVLIFAADPAFTVYYYPVNNQAKLAEFQKKTPAGKYEILDFGVFRNDPVRHILSKIIHSDFPDHDQKTAAGLIEMLEYGYGSAGLGVTWNGGIALTRNDYDHAKKSFAAYQKDPKSWNPNLAQNFPVSPFHHLQIFRSIKAGGH